MYVYSWKSEYPYRGGNISHVDSAAHTWNWASSGAEFALYGQKSVLATYFVAMLQWLCSLWLATTGYYQDHGQQIQSAWLIFANIYWCNNGLTFLATFHGAQGGEFTEYGIEVFKRRIVITQLICRHHNNSIIIRLAVLFIHRNIIASKQKYNKIACTIQTCLSMFHLFLHYDNDLIWCETQIYQRG